MFRMYNFSVACWREYNVSWQPCQPGEILRQLWTPLSTRQGWKSVENLFFDGYLHFIYLITHNKCLLHLYLILYDLKFKKYDSLGFNFSWKVHIFIFLSKNYRNGKNLSERRSHMFISNPDFYLAECHRGFVSLDARDALCIDGVLNKEPTLILIKSNV